MWQLLKHYFFGNLNSELIALFYSSKRAEHVTTQHPRTQMRAYILFVIFDAVSDFANADIERQG